MPTPVKMPRLGESVAEGTVGSWLKKEGDWIEKDESLAEIITDKINAELPSPVAGRLAKILVQADETVAVGVDIALIEENADVASTPSAEPAPGPDAAPVKSPERANIAVMDKQSASSDTNGSRAAAQPQHISEEERQRISPLARRLAREHDIDLNEVPGTGTGGRVRKEDILAYVEQRNVVPAPVAPAPPLSPPPPAPYTPPAPMPVAQPAYSAPVAAKPEPMTPVAGPDEELMVPSRMRLAIAEHMVRSKRTSPHATTVVEVDMTRYREVAGEEQRGLQEARRLWHQLRAIRHEGRVRGHPQIPADQFLVDGR